MTREIINLQIGQCGIQFGHEFWKQICLEHQINPDGSNFPLKKKKFSENRNPFFHQSCRGRYVPRAILLDLEPRIVSNILNSTFGDLYEKNNVLAEKQGAGNNWANGYNRAIEYQKEIQEALRKESEKCDRLGSFNLLHSTVGGTGSGVGSLTLELIREEFPGKFINAFSVVPNQFEVSDVVVQPYNSILSMRWLSLYCDCVTFFENDSLQNTIELFDKKPKLSLLQVNTLIARILSAITSPVRFPNYWNTEFESLFAPLIPFPSFHFLFSGMSGFSFRNKKKFPRTEPFDTSGKNVLNKTINLNFHEGKLISSSKFFKKKDSVEKIPSRFQNFLSENEIKCIEWAPVCLQSFSENFKGNKRHFFDEEVFLFNHTSIKNLFKKTLHHYDLLRKRNAFLNGFLREFPLGEGLELFDDARETLLDLLVEYNRAESKIYPHF